MLEQISPYALLCACKPRRVTVPASPYDLYSTVHQANAQERLPDAAAQPALPQEPASVPARRTHYISDIHARHTRASLCACSPGQRP